MIARSWRFYAGHLVLLCFGSSAESFACTLEHVRLESSLNVSLRTRAKSPLQLTCFLDVGKALRLTGTCSLRALLTSSGLVSPAGLITSNQRNDLGLAKGHDEEGIQEGQCYEPEGLL